MNWKDISKKIGLFGLAVASGTVINSLIYGGDLTTSITSLVNIAFVSGVVITYGLYEYMFRAKGR